MRFLPGTKSSIEDRSQQSYLQKLEHLKHVTFAEDAAAISIYIGYAEKRGRTRRVRVWWQTPSRSEAKVLLLRKSSTGRKCCKRSLMTIPRSCILRRRCMLCSIWPAACENDARPTKQVMCALPLCGIETLSLTLRSPSGKFWERTAPAKNHRNASMAT
jgi:hypothetical protein